MRHWRSWKRWKSKSRIAYRYDYDGYGYRFIDNGSGSNWAERGKASNGEPLYVAPVAQTEPTLKWCEQCGEGVTDFCRGKGDNKCRYGFGKAGAHPAEPVEPDLRHQIRVHLANRYQHSHREFCEKLEEIMAAAKGKE